MRRPARGGKLGWPPGWEVPGKHSIFLIRGALRQEDGASKEDEMRFLKAGILALGLPLLAGLDQAWSQSANQGAPGAPSVATLRLTPSIDALPAAPLRLPPLA